MLKPGEILEEKYKILAKLGKGGMSTVYLAMDTNLNKQWAIKEVEKKGKKNDQTIFNSFIAESEMMKNLDHPSLPRIVGIFNKNGKLYIIMDYIEGESLGDKLKKEGPQSEEDVIDWAKQLCDVLNYLHSKNIIYRDMKPSNVMLKPEGNIKIIDFGIAREYKADSDDTQVLGTRGYAPPEQYSGKTEKRSDIYALGMTMHNLLTGVSPGNGQPYAPVRQWNPNLSESIEIIIDKCVEPNPENRYKTCNDLLYDLEHPEYITKGYKKTQKRKVLAVAISFGLALIMFITGLSTQIAAYNIKNKDYDFNLTSSDPDKYYSAVEIYPSRIEAYNKLIEYYKNHDVNNEQLTKVGNTIENNAEYLDLDKSDVANLYYDIGKLFFSEYEGSFKSRAVSAQNFFKSSVESKAHFEKKEIAECYYTICRFMTNQSNTTEHSLTDFENLFNEINDTLNKIEKANDGEANYDKISLYYVATLLVNDQVEYMAGVGFDRNDTLELIDLLYKETNSIISTLPYVNSLKDEIITNHDSFITNINAKYNEVEKRQNGGV